MTFAERNVFLLRKWKELSEEERNEFNRRALSEDVIKKEQIKRTWVKTARIISQAVYLAANRLYQWRHDWTEHHNGSPYYPGHFQRPL